jgi:hypothetical protein
MAPLLLAPVQFSTGECIVSHSLAATVATFTRRQCCHPGSTQLATFEFAAHLVTVWADTCWGKVGSHLLSEGMCLAGF